MQTTTQSDGPGWILVAGLVLVAFAALNTPEARQTDPGNQVNERSVSLPAYATADSNGSMIAVTGIDVTGSSILYLIDTERKHLSVYQAQGGTGSTMNVKWVGARRLDLDFQVEGYNDDSEYSYKELEGKFESSGSAIPPK